MWSGHRLNINSRIGLVLRSFGHCFLLVAPFKASRREQPSLLLSILSELIFCTFCHLLHFLFHLLRLVSSVFWGSKIKHFTSLQNSLAEAMQSNLVQFEKNVKNIKTRRCGSVYFGVIVLAYWVRVKNWKCACTSVQGLMMGLCTFKISQSLCFLVKFQPVISSLSGGEISRQPALSYIPEL